MIENDLPTAWTPDSQAVLFHSDRNGKWEISKQALDERTAELLITGSHDCRGARISGAEGAWTFCFARNRDSMWSWSEPLTLMRTPLTGGRPSVVLSKRQLYSVRCARPPAARQVLCERKLKHLVFYTFIRYRGGAENSHEPRLISRWIKATGTSPRMVRGSRSQSAVSLAASESCPWPTIQLTTSPSTGGQDFSPWIGP